MRLRLEDIEAKGQSLLLGSGKDVVEHKLRPYDLHVQLLCDAGFAEAGKLGGGLGILQARLQDADLGAFLKVTFYMLEKPELFAGIKDEASKILEPLDGFIHTMAQQRVPAEVLQLLVTKALQEGQPVLDGAVKKKALMVLNRLAWITALSTICWLLATRGCH